MLVHHEASIKSFAVLYNAQVITAMRPMGIGPEAGQLFETLRRRLASRNSEELTCSQIPVLKIFI